MSAGLQLGQQEILFTALFFFPLFLYDLSSKPPSVGAGREKKEEEKRANESNRVFIIDAIS